MMIQEIKRAIRLSLLTIFIAGIGYTASVQALAFLVSPQGRQGSLIYDESGLIVGSDCLAQSFTRDEYLWPRPSAVDYNASAAGGSNLSPGSEKIRQFAMERIRKFEVDPKNPIPVDLVLMSGSGLDPHISMDAAIFQIDRIARARKIEPAILRDRIEMESSMESTSLSKLMKRDGLIHVLHFNIMLDQLYPVRGLDEK